MSVLVSSRMPAIVSSSTIGGRSAAFRSANECSMPLVWFLRYCQSRFCMPAGSIDQPLDPAGSLLYSSIELAVPQHTPDARPTRTLPAHITIQDPPEITPDLPLLLMGLHVPRHTPEHASHALSRACMQERRSRRRTGPSRRAARGCGRTCGPWAATQCTCSACWPPAPAPACLAPSPTGGPMCVLHMLCLVLHCSSLAADSYGTVAVLLSVGMLSPPSALALCFS